MKRLLCNILALCLVLAVAGTASAVEIRLKDGSTWRGAVSDTIDLTYLEQNVEVQVTAKLMKVADLYIVVETHIAGELRQKTVFKGDVVSIRTVGGPAAEPPRASSKSTGRRTAGEKATDDMEIPRDASGRPIGVIVLPLEGFVGGPFRRDEIKKVGEKADELGPGQIIVLLINSDGGSSLESQFIAQEIDEIKKRHRVVAWIKKAISAGCQTAMCCDEIYFMTEGTAGAVTTWNPGTGQSIKDEELEKAMEHLADIAERSGYSKYIAYAMKTNSAVCSYDKDPETGEVTFYDDKSGEFLLSDEDSNLSFTSSVAEHCGFSKGTADTEEELAALLDLPRWHEVTDHGRKIAKKWQSTVERAEDEIPRLLARLDYWKSGSGDQEEVLGGQISILKQLIRWHGRCPNVAQMRLPPKDYLERQLTELQKQMSDLKRRDR